jgi:hypothetical protein
MLYESKYHLWHSPSRSMQKKFGDRRDVPHFRRVRHPRGFESWRFGAAWNRQLPLRLMRLHVGAQDGVDAGLIAAFAAKPAQQVGIEAHGDRFFWRGQHYLG